MTETSTSQPSRTAKLLTISLIFSGITGAIGVALLAISAHADTSGLLKTSAQMLLFHAPAVLAIGLLAQARNVPGAPFVFGAMAAGIWLFSGDMIARVLLHTHLFPMAAPAGGLLTIGSWIALALSALRIKPNN